MIPLESVAYDTVAPLAGRDFTVTTGNGPVTLQLTEVQKLGHKRADAQRDPFSILFRGPSGLRMPQATYPIAGDGLGEVAIFITQVADGPHGSEFEAIFT